MRQADMSLAVRCNGRVASSVALLSPAGVAVLSAPDAAARGGRNFRKTPSSPSSRVRAATSSARRSGRTFGIAYNVLLAERRKAIHRATESLQDDAAGQEPFDHDPGIWVRNALAGLDDDIREILMLREYEQLSYQEIAAVRGTPLNTVRSHLFRARMALKEALETRVPQAVRTTHGGR